MSSKDAPMHLDTLKSRMTPKTSESVVFENVVSSQPQSHSQSHSHSHSLALPLPLPSISSVSTLENCPAHPRTEMESTVYQILPVSPSKNTLENESRNLSVLMSNSVGNSAISDIFRNSIVDTPNLAGSKISSESDVSGRKSDRSTGISKNQSTEGEYHVPTHFSTFSTTENPRVIETLAPDQRIILDLDEESDNEVEFQKSDGIPEFPREIPPKILSKRKFDEIFEVSEVKSPGTSPLHKISKKDGDDSRATSDIWIDPALTNKGAHISNGNMTTDVQMGDSTGNSAGNSRNSGIPPKSLRDLLENPKYKKIVDLTIVQNAMKGTVKDLSEITKKIKHSKRKIDKFVNILEKGLQKDAFVVYGFELPQAAPNEAFESLEKLKKDFRENFLRISISAEQSIVSELKAKMEKGVEILRQKLAPIKNSELQDFNYDEFEKLLWHGILDKIQITENVQKVIEKEKEFQKIAEIQEKESEKIATEELPTSEIIRQIIREELGKSKAKFSKKSPKKCKIHGKCSHSTSECRNLNKNDKPTSSNNQKKKKCKIHGFCSHSTSECRDLHPKNSRIPKKTWNSKKTGNSNNLAGNSSNKKKNDFPGKRRSYADAVKAKQQKN